MTANTPTGTQSAVTEFQSRNGLTADGIAGRATQDKFLFRVGAAQDGQRERGGQRLRAASRRARPALDVRKLQGRLAELGYYAGGVDGILRLDDDQRGQGLPAGERPERRRAGGQPDADEAVFRQREIRGQPSDDGEPGSNAHADDRHDGQRRLHALQERLIELNYLSGVADGVFGAETQNALTAFRAETA